MIKKAVSKKTAFFYAFYPAYCYFNSTSLRLFLSILRAGQLTIFPLQYSL